jgi:hypothetical protein
MILLGRSQPRVECRLSMRHLVSRITPGLGRWPVPDRRFRDTEAMDGPVGVGNTVLRAASPNTELVHRVRQPGAVLGTCAPAGTSVACTGGRRIWACPHEQPHE